MTETTPPVDLLSGVIDDPRVAGTPLRELATEKGPRERKLPGRRALVTLDGLEPFEVRIDNRDYLRWDKTAPRQKWVTGGKDAPPTPVFLMATFLAWSAATRAQQTDLTFAQFEAACLEVEEQTADDSDEARPTP